jgi:spore germination cell wall hydrolase CwlJ-like protein
MSLDSNTTALILKLGMELFCVTDAMINEASVDGDEGMLGVALVIKNRVQDTTTEFKNTACDVVSQPSNDPSKPWACHFSFKCDDREDFIRDEDVAEYLRVAELARKVDSEEISDFTMGSLYYTKCTIYRTWMDNTTPTLSIGSHCYYKRK